MSDMAAQPTVRYYSALRLLWLALSQPASLRQALERDARTHDLEARVTAQDQLLRDLEAQVRAAESRSSLAEIRADTYHHELIHSYKTHENWLASGLANRTIHADAPLPERPAPPSYRDAEGNPIELPGRGVRLRDRTRKDDAKISELIGKSRQDFEKWAEQHLEDFYTPETALSNATDPMEALKKAMGSPE